MTHSALPNWPAMMKRSLAARYCDLTPVEFEREIAEGKLPQPVMLGKAEHWSRSGLDKALDALAGDGAEWFNGSPLYKRDAA